MTTQPTPGSSAVSSPDRHSPSPARPPGAASARLIRLAEMLFALFQEVRGLDLDEHTQARLLHAHRRAWQELERTLPPKLADEFGRVRLRFNSDPTRDELRLAQAQLVGWLHGALRTLAVKLKVDVNVDDSPGDGDKARQPANQT